MVSKIYTVAFKGIEALEILTEVQLSPGLPAFNIVGLPDKAVGESKERIRACFESLALSFPLKRITVNLAPADIQKEGSHYDLPIALALLCEMKVLQKEIIEHYLAIGELGLDGRLCKAQGVLCAAIHSMKSQKIFICPFENSNEASWSGHKDILNPKSLFEIILYFQKKIELKITEVSTLKNSKNHLDMIDVKGQFLGRRALEIAAAGGHHMLMIGPPGVGKSMLAQRVSSILPNLSPQEALHVTMIYSLAGLLNEEGLVIDRPFRDPHHSTSPVALVGGGHKCKPGEISLSHFGVLFMDEFPEFSRQTLESLRQPLETKRITIARANYHVTYPSHIQLIAAMNPCRCGMFFDEKKQCHKAPECFLEYRNKISGPLMDRFDIVVNLDNISSKDILKMEQGECSENILKRVTMARDIQKDRSQKLNSELEGSELSKHCDLLNDSRETLLKSIETCNISARGVSRILKVSRTIADLDMKNENQIIKKSHIIEALSYRQINI